MNQSEKLSSLATEKINPNTVHIDCVSSLEMAAMMNNEDKQVALAVEQALPSIARAIDCITQVFENGGRLIYIGAGTSGRLGMLDASECIPTFGVSENMVIGLIAGGDKALKTAVEGAEDNTEAGVDDLRQIHFSNKDILVGIAASGRTPYVLSALKYAKSLGAKTIALSCVSNAECSLWADVPIEVATGAEALSGSTRLKAGTAQKMVLNMLSTGSMIKIGKVYRNLMVDVVATNEKLEERALRIVMEAGNTDRKAAAIALKAAENHVKTAIYMLKTGCNEKVAAAALKTCNGHLQLALEQCNNQ